MAKREPSRADRFDRADFGTRYAATVGRLDKPSVTTDEVETSPTRVRRAAWPVARGEVQRIGDSVLADRDGKGRPHKGLDIFAAADTKVLAALDGQVLRVVDGRQGETVAQHRAGLFVDVLGRDSLVYRYLHLGHARVETGPAVAQGSVLGTVAEAFTSGLRETPHLHFEIRQGDFNRSERDYGRPIDPLRRLPPLRV